MTHDYDRSVSVAALARVEGEGAMQVRVLGDRVAEVRLDIYEPPRYFEALLRGRSYLEPPDITARICGICPVAYQMSAIQAIESLCGVTVPDGIRQLRRLLYCGEWIESHVLHVFLLHAPDFLGYQGAIEMAGDHRDLVEMALRLRKAGNTLLEIIGGRAVHPINPRVGGFHRLPRRDALEGLVEELRWCLDATAETVRFVADLEFPQLTTDHAYVALRPSDGSGPPGATGYPIEDGRLVTTSGVHAPVQAWAEYFAEEQQPHSTALHGRMRNGRDGTYLLGPLARFNLNADRLPVATRALADTAGINPPVVNPFHSIVVRALETHYALDEALRLIDAYDPPEVAAVPVQPVAGTGHGATEAPRGILYHRYTLAADGTITAATIVPPTAQNQPAIEADLAGFVQTHLHLDDDALQWRCEQAIRNYDPCISCATHFLQLTVDRS